MEEDIKILEEFKKNGYSILFMKYQDRNITNSHIERALENLLTRYKKLEQENNNFKEASIINDILYKEVCNKNKELEEENKELQKSVEQIYDDYQDAGRLMFEYSEKLEDSIPKSLIKEKIEEIDKWLDNGKYARYGINPYELKAQKEVLEELLRRGEIRCVSIATNK